MTYLLALDAATLLRVVAIAAAIARATGVRLRLVAQAIAGIATSELIILDMPSVRFSNSVEVTYI